MRSPSWPVSLIALIVVALGAVACDGVPGGSGTATATIPGYHVVKDLPLPGGTGRWDYQAFDPASHRLYIAHLGTSELVVFDTQLERVVSVLSGISSIHGVALAPDQGRLFASATGTNEIVAVDLGTLRVIGRSAAGDYPDGLDYVPDLGKVYVSDEHGSGDAIVEAKALHLLGSVALGGDIGNTKYDPQAQLIVVAVGSTNELVTVDPRSDRVVGRAPLPGCQGAHSVQLTQSPRRAFVACAGNGKVAVYDFATNRVLAIIEVGDNPDVMAYDSGLQRIYVASEDGILAVIRAADPIRRITQGNAGPNAHTVAVDPSTHLVYLPMDIGGKPTMRIASP